MTRVTTFAIGAVAVAALAATASSVFNGEDPAGLCDPAEIFAEDFDGVIPPTLPPEWVATNAIDPDGYSGLPRTLVILPLQPILRRTPRLLITPVRSATSDSTHPASF